MISAESGIEAARILNGLTGLSDVKKDFFYDETNNYRKVHFADGKLNFDGDGDFVLGGAVLGRGIDINIDELKDRIKLDKSAKEMKFKHVASGNFISILNSKKLKTVLEFVDQNGICIHLQRVNVFYWSVIDIIESVIAKMDGHHDDIIINHLYIKDLLYQLLNYKKKESLIFLQRFSYPDVDESKLSDFYDGLLDIARSQLNLRDYVAQLLIRTLEMGRDLQEAVFIQNEDRGILIDDFSHFYRSRVLTFPNSIHYFDAEHKVEANLRSTSNSFGGQVLNNYFFADSTLNPGIQLSDVIVGYFARLLNFCKGKSHDELRSIRRCLNKKQLELIDLSRKIIDQSDLEHRGYFNHIAPMSEIATWGILLSEFI